MHIASLSKSHPLHDPCKLNIGFEARLLKCRLERLSPYRELTTRSNSSSVAALSACMARCRNKNRASTQHVDRHNVNDMML